MSGNPNIHVFTDETLQEHDRQLAAAIHEVTVASTVRKLNKMNPGQLLKASTNNGKSLCWSSEKLNKVLVHIYED